MYGIRHPLGNAAMGSWSQPVHGMRSRLCTSGSLRAIIYITVWHTVPQSHIQGNPYVARQQQLTRPSSIAAAQPAQPAQASIASAASTSQQLPTAQPAQPAQSAHNQSSQHSGPPGLNPRCPRARPPQPTQEDLFGEILSPRAAAAAAAGAIKESVGSAASALKLLAKSPGQLLSSKAKRYQGLRGGSTDFEEQDNGLFDVDEDDDDDEVFGNGYQGAGTGAGQASLMPDTVERSAPL
jgi:hypothetical protein